MKKLFLCAFVFVCSLFLLTSCGEHKHTFSKDWTYDTEYHFHKCTDENCLEVEGKEAHNFNGNTCSVCGFEKEGQGEVSNLTISEVLASKNNQDVKTKGVVFGKTNDGFYIADSNSGVLVKLVASQLASLNDVKHGDEVEITGKFALNNGQPFMKNASFTVLSSDKEVLSAVESNIKSVIDLKSNEKANYGKLFKVTAAVTLDAAGRVVLVDNSGSVIIDNKGDYTEYVGKKINTNIVLLKMGDGSDGWISYGFKETVSEYQVDLDDVKEAIFASFTLPTEVVGVLNLPTTYEAEPGVVFNWTVKSGSSITVNNNAADVSFDGEADEDVVLTLTISANGKTATNDYTVKVKVVRAVTFEEGKLLGDEFGVVTGLVVARGTADEKSQYHYIFIMEEATNSLAVIDVDGPTKLSVEVGDRIQAVVNYRADVRPSFTNVKALKVVAQDIAIDYASLNPVTLETVEDYKDAANNHHDEVRLYYVVNPFMARSGDTSYSWNVFGPTKDSATSGVTSTRYFSFLIDNFKQNGLEDIEEGFEIPLKGEGGKQYAGSNFYCYSIYQTGETRWSFVIPCREAYVYDEAGLVKSYLTNNVESEVEAQIDGTITLPTSAVLNDKTYNITWTSNNEAINVQTGAFTKVLEDTFVTLTATFKVGEEDVTYDIEVKLIAAEVLPITISEAVALQNGVVAKLHAYVAAVASTSNNNVQFRNGLMLTDGKKVVWYKTTNYQIGDVVLNEGDLIEIKNATIECDENGNSLTDGEIKVLSTGNTIDYENLEVAVTVENDEELSAFIKSHGVTKGLVVKFTGSFFFVGTGSSADNPRYQINYKNAASSAASRYEFGDAATRSLAISMPCTELLLGPIWETVGFEKATGSKSIALEGTIYAVGGFNGSTLQAWTIINKAGFELSLAKDASKVKTYLEEQVKTSVTAKEDGVYELISSVMIGEKSYNITWTSSDNELLDPSTGAYKKATEDKVVTLTAKYTVNEKEYTYSFDLEIKKPQQVVTSVATLHESGEADAEYLVEGVVIGFSSDGNKAEENKGFILMDPTTGKVMNVKNINSADVYPSYNYKNNEEKVAIGDKVQVSGVYKVNGFEKSVDLGANGELTFVSKETLSFNDELVTVIKTDAELEALISSGDYFNKIIKLEATQESPLHVSGSGTGNSTECNYKIGFHYGDGENVNQIYYGGGKVTISTKSTVNAINCGETPEVLDGTYSCEFGKTLYGSTHSLGKLAASSNNERVGNLYIVINYKTSTYYQSSIVNFAGATLTAAQVAE